MSDLRILAVPGSLRAGSDNTALLHAAADLADRDGLGVAIEVWGGLGTIPPFDEDVEDDTPAAVTDLRAAIAAADALLISTPEYNGALPGQLKNALDWASRPYGDCVLDGLPVAVTSASPSRYGAVQAAEQLAAVIEASGGTVLGRRVALPHSDGAFTDDGRLVDPTHDAALADLVRELGALAANRCPTA